MRTRETTLLVHSPTWEFQMPEMGSGANFQEGEKAGWAGLGWGGNGSQYLDLAKPVTWPGSTREKSAGGFSQERGICFKASSMRTRCHFYVMCGCKCASTIQGRVSLNLDAETSHPN